MRPVDRGDCANYFSRDPENASKSFPKAAVEAIKACKATARAAYEAERAADEAENTTRERAAELAKTAAELVPKAIDCSKLAQNVNIIATLEANVKKAKEAAEEAFKHAQNHKFDEAAQEAERAAGILISCRLIISDVCKLAKKPSKEYKDAKEPLVARLGEYCSYCERTIPAKLEVEHMAPEEVYPERKYDWDNFLLGCGNCNPTKGAKHKVQLTVGGTRHEEIEPVTYCFWPDRIGQSLERSGEYASDSFNVFLYREDGTVIVHPKVPDGRTQDRVIATIALVGLDMVLDDKEIEENKPGYIDPVAGMQFLTGPPTNPSPSDARCWNRYTISEIVPSPNLMSGGVNPPPASSSATFVPRNTSAEIIKRLHEARVGAGHAKDFRAVQRYEAFELATWYRRKFDRLLPGNISPTNNEKRKARLRKKEKNENELAQTRENLTPQERATRLAMMPKFVNKQAKATGFWSVWVTVFKNQNCFYKDDTDQSVAGPARDDSFKQQPAIIPVLDKLLDKRLAFPGTREPHEFNPPIYTIPGDKDEWDTLTENNHARNPVDEDDSDTESETEEEDENDIIMGGGDSDTEVEDDEGSQNNPSILMTPDEIELNNLAKNNHAGNPDVDKDDSTKKKRRNGSEQPSSSKKMRLS